MVQFEQTTDKIRILVEPVFLEEQSEPQKNRFVWAYHVRIENHGAETLQLVSRYWRITDSLGRTQEVSGPGVVGEQPVLSPGESFEYTSGTPLGTNSGFMEGRYNMVRLDGPDAGGALEVAVPAFSLDSPGLQGRPN